MALETATFAGGCFWCVEAVFQALKGVQAVESGYAGGHVPNPTYEQVCGKKTGHAEVIRLTFDPEAISFRELLEVFFVTHDPTTKNRQGNDVGPQYRSAVFYESEEQKRITEEVIAELAGAFPSPIVTEVVPFANYYPAEDYHQNYYNDNPGDGYCNFAIPPKLAKLRAKFASKLM